MAPCRTPAFPTVCGCRSSSSRRGWLPTWRISPAPNEPRISSPRTTTATGASSRCAGRPGPAPDPDDLFRPEPQRFRGHAHARRLALFPGGAGALRLPTASGAADAARPRGSQIKVHRDHDFAFEQGTVRIHVPVTTNAEVDFRLNGVRCAMPAGSAWYLRLSDPHSVANRGAQDRVHLVDRRRGQRLAHDPVRTRGRGRKGRFSAAGGIPLWQKGP